MIEASGSSGSLSPSALEIKLYSLGEGSVSLPFFFLLIFHVSLQVALPDDHGGIPLFVYKEYLVAGGDVFWPGFISPVDLSLDTLVNPVPLAFLSGRIRLKRSSPA